MRYEHTAICESEIPQAAYSIFQHLLDTYVSEANKVSSTWRWFTDADLDWCPHSKSQSVRDVLRHQLLSERRFFAQFLGVPEPDPENILPEDASVEGHRVRFVELVKSRLPFLALCNETWWTMRVPFFDVERERIWVFWRRVLHTAHHRTQLTVYLRLLDRPVPAVYGPTADVTWSGADPTNTVQAAGRR